MDSLDGTISRQKNIVINRFSQTFLFALQPRGKFRNADIQINRGARTLCNLISARIIEDYDLLKFGQISQTSRVESASESVPRVASGSPPPPPSSRIITSGNSRTEEEEKKKARKGRSPSGDLFLSSPPIYRETCGRGGTTCRALKLRKNGERAARARGSRGNGSPSRGGKKKDGESPPSRKVSRRKARTRLGGGGGK